MDVGEARLRGRVAPVDGDAGGGLGVVLQPLACVGAPGQDGLAGGLGPLDGGAKQPAADAPSTEGLRDLGVDEDELVAVYPVDELRVDAVLPVEEAVILGVVDDADSVLA